MTVFSTAAQAGLVISQLGVVGGLSSLESLEGDLDAAVVGDDATGEGAQVDVTVGGALCLTQGSDLGLVGSHSRSQSRSRPIWLQGCLQLLEGSLDGSGVADGGAGEGADVGRAVDCAEGLQDLTDVGGRCAASVCSEEIAVSLAEMRVSWPAMLMPLLLATEKVLSSLVSSSWRAPLIVELSEIVRPVNRPRSVLLAPTPDRVARSAMSARTAGSTLIRCR